MKLYAPDGTHMVAVDDAHSWNKQLDRAFRNLADAAIDDRDREAIEAFADHRRYTEDVATSTLVTDVDTLRRCAERSKTPLVDFEGVADTNAILKINQSAFDVSDSSNDNYRRALRVFFAWLDDQEGGYGWWEDVIIPHREVQELDPTTFLDLGDVRALVDAADHPRDKALVEFLADTGMRVTAAMQVKRGGVEGLDGPNPTFTPNRDGEGQKGIKTLPLPIIQSQQYLRVWLREYHPEDHPDAPVFCVRDYHHRRRNETALSPSRVRDLLKELAESAGLERGRIHPHAFRHVATTRMRRDMGMDWDDIAHRTGWSDNTISRMKQLYGHLTHEDRNRRVFGYAGRADVDGEDEGPVFVECVNCRREMPSTKRYCGDCGTDQEAEFVERDLRRALGQLDAETADTVVALIEGAQASD